MDHHNITSIIQTVQKLAERLERIAARLIQAEETRLRATWAEILAASYNRGWDDHRAAIERGTGENLTPEESDRSRSPTPQPTAAATFRLNSRQRRNQKRLRMYLAKKKDANQSDPQ